MFRLMNLSAVILVIGMLQQTPTLGNITVEELFYPIRLLGHPKGHPQQGVKGITRYSNPKLTYLKTIKPKEKNRQNRLSAFDSSIPANHKTRQEDKTQPFQGLTLDTVAADDDRTSENEDSHRITVFDSSVPSKQDKTNVKIPAQYFTLDTDDEQSKENNGIPVFHSSIPKRYDENQDPRKVFVQGLTIHSTPRSNDQADSKQKLHRTSVFDDSAQRKQEEVDVSKETTFQGLSIPIKDSNKINSKIDLGRVSIFRSSSLQKKEQQKQKESMEYEEDDDEESGEEQNDTEEKESLEEPLIYKTSTRTPYKQGSPQVNGNKAIQYTNVFNSKMLSDNDDEDEIKTKNTIRTETVHKNELPNRRNELHRITVFDSTPFYPESLPVVDQTLLGDGNTQDIHNQEKGLKHIPILDSSLINKRKYQSDVLGEDIPSKHININNNSTGQENKVQESKQKELHKKGLKKKKSKKKKSKKKKSKKKKSKKRKFVFDSATISEFGDNLAHIGDNSNVAHTLAESVRVLCWVMTYPANHDKKAKHIKETWGKRCNILLFMSSEEDFSLPTVDLHVQEDYNHIWGKTKAAFKYIHKYYRNDAEWFLKADDDTYVIVENLRFMLNEYNCNDPIYFGFRFKASFAPKQGYASGGAGYVLSREALDRFVKNALPSNDLCKKDNTGAEDAEIGKCLERVGVKLMDSRDSYDRNRFFPFMPHDHVDSTIDPKYWYWQMIYNPIDTGRDCCSEYAISFHYVDPGSMYVLEYFIYHLRPYGISYHFDTIYNVVL